MGEGRGNGAMIGIMLLSCMLVFHCEIAHAKTYIVGDARGWGYYVRDWPYTPVDKNFVNGDEFVFKYNPKLDSVVKVNQEDYNSCNSKGALAVYKSGNDRILLPTGVHFFISRLYENCRSHGVSMALQVS